MTKIKTDVYDPRLSFTNILSQYIKDEEMLRKAIEECNEFAHDYGLYEVSVAEAGEDI